MARIDDLEQGRRDLKVTLKSQLSVYRAINRDIKEEKKNTHTYIGGHIIPGWSHD